MIDYRGSTGAHHGRELGTRCRVRRTAGGARREPDSCGSPQDRLDALRHELESRHGVTVSGDRRRSGDRGGGSHTWLRSRERAGGCPCIRSSTTRGSAPVTALRARMPTASTRRSRSNVAAVVDLTRAFYPELLRHGSGVLVNVASTAAFQPVPRMAVYGATKAFVLSFTEALWVRGDVQPGSPSSPCVRGRPPPSSSMWRARRRAPAGCRAPRPWCGRRSRRSTAAIRRRVSSAGFTNVAATIAERVMPRRALVNSVGRITARY